MPGTAQASSTVKGADWMHSDMQSAMLDAGFQR
jgi:hypothetical protein